MKIRKPIIGGSVEQFPPFVSFPVSPLAPLPALPLRGRPPGGPGAASGIPGNHGLWSRPLDPGPLYSPSGASGLFPCEGCVRSSRRFLAFLSATDLPEARERQAVFHETTECGSDRLSPGPLHSPSGAPGLFPREACARFSHCFRAFLSPADLAQARRRRGPCREPRLNALGIRPGPPCVHSRSPGAGPRACGLCHSPFGACGLRASRVSLARAAFSASLWFRRSRQDPAEGGERRQDREEQQKLLCMLEEKSRLLALYLCALLSLRGAHALSIPQIQQPPQLHPPCLQKRFM